MVLLYVMEVEEYTRIHYFEMLRISEDKNIAHIQGRPILIEYSKNFSEELLQQFFSLTFSYLSKIVLLKDGSYSILCNKYAVERIEPFDTYTDVTAELANNSKATILYILK